MTHHQDEDDDDDDGEKHAWAPRGPLEITLVVNNLHRDPPTGNLLDLISAHLSLQVSVSAYNVALRTTKTTTANTFNPHTH